MRAIYKYPLTMAETQTIKMPRGAKVVYVDKQGEEASICLWAEINLEHVDDLVDRRFDIVAGHIITQDDAFYVGTVQMPANMWGNVFVWHVYEVPLV